MLFSAITVNPLFDFVGDPDSLVPHGAARVECSLPTFDAGMGCLGYMLITFPFQVSGCAEVRI
jgi:hypothetical protein